MKFNEKGELIDDAGNLILDSKGQPILKKNIGMDPAAPPADPPAANNASLTPEEEVMAELKKILPTLVDAKNILVNVPGNSESIKTVQDELKGLQGSITDLTSKIVEIGKRKITVIPSGLTREAKFDFAKFLCNCFKQKHSGGSSESIRNEIKEFHAKYSTTYNKTEDDKKLKTAMNEGTDAQGGYGVPDLFLDTIWRIAEQQSVALRNCTIIPLTTGYKLPVIGKDGGVSISWVDEGDPAQESEPTLKKSTTAALKMLVYSKVSNELLEDEEIGLIDFIITLWGEAIGVEIDEQAFSGDGTQFTGILNTAGVNTTNMSSGVFTGVSWDNLSDGDANLKAAVKIGAKWFFHRTILNILRKKKDSNNNYLWQPSPGADRPATIWDYPYEEVEAMPSSADTATATPFILFGNMKNYLIGTKGGMTVRISDVPFMLNDQTIIMVRRRIAMVAALPAAFSVIKTAVS